MGRETAFFLALGVMLSVASKLLQFNARLRSFHWLGNMVVLPAATCLTLAALFALPQYRRWYEAGPTRAQAWLLAGLACAAVLSFQLLTMLLAAKRPLGAAAWGCVRTWVELT